MKYIPGIILLAAALLSTTALRAQTVTEAGNPDVTFIGRTVREGGTVKADWSGTLAIVRFEGSTLSMEYDESAVDYLNVWIDREPVVEADRVLKLEGGGSLSLVSFKRKGEHTVYIQKRTEGETGCITFRSFTTDGRLLPARPWKDRVIEFVGDSYTCGYGVEAPDRNSPHKWEEQNCNKSYSGILGRYFDADVVRVSHSGRGIIRNYGDADQGGDMPVRYLRALDCCAEPGWEPSYEPDIVVIYLGTNDFSVGKQPSLDSWCAAYGTLLQEIRDNYGSEVPILCVASNADPMLSDYVRTAVARCSLPNVSWTAINSGAHNITTDLGASWHPNYSGMRKVASLMAPYIATLTGWDLPVKPLE